MSKAANQFESCFPENCVLRKVWFYLSLVGYLKEFLISREIIDKYFKSALLFNNKALCFQHGLWAREFLVAPTASDYGIFFRAYAYAYRLCRKNGGAYAISAYKPWFSIKSSKKVLQIRNNKYFFLKMSKASF